MQRTDLFKPLQVLHGWEWPDGTFCDGDCDKHAIIWVDKEGSLSITFDRLVALGVDTNRIFTNKVSMSI